MFSKRTAIIKYSALMLTFAVSFIPAEAKLLSGHIEQIKEADVQLEENPQSQASNSFPDNYIGVWHCQTTVTDSQVDTVAKGTSLACDIQFVPDKTGKVTGQWIQPGWVETQISTLSWNPKEAKVDRTSYYFGQSMVQGGSWACRSRDHFIQISESKMECQSYIDQYIDGRYLGRYRTKSLLTRALNSNNGVISTTSAF
ncbi:hypothetical protein KA183_02810 [bacterium]|nr:hypothetical protein [bacterium]QQR58688.1 MAG: hypothetical protein IPG59_04085 [Candidatus Melainabacteria bacterium]